MVHHAPRQINPLDKDSIEGLAVRSASDCLNIEARLVAAGWHDPAALRREADMVGLRGVDFSDDLAGLIFNLLLAAADVARPLTTATVRAVAARHAVPIPDPGFPDGITLIRQLEIGPTGIGNYTRIVAANVRCVAEAKEHLKTAAEILSSFPSTIQRAVRQAAILRQRRRARRPSNTSPRTGRRMTA